MNRFALCLATSCSRHCCWLPMLLMVVIAAAIAMNVGTAEVAASDWTNHEMHSTTAAPHQSLTGQLTVTIDDRPLTLSYWPHSIRSENFRVQVQLDDGSFKEVDAAPARTVRGMIDELPGSEVVGSMQDDGLRAQIILPDGRVYDMESHELRAAFDVEPKLRGLPETASSIECMIAQIAIDADFHFYLAYDSDVDLVVDHIESLINAVNIQFENEVGIVHEISEIIVRASAAQDPYSSNNAITLMNQFRNVWSSEPEASIERAVAHLFTGRNLDGGVTGLSFIGVVCDVPNAYALIQDLSIDFECMTDLVARNLGYNWGATTCTCPGTTMNTTPSCANTFIGDGSTSIEEILAYKDSVDCLEPCSETDCALADLNCDTVVDGADLLILLSNWGECADAEECLGDLNDDGNVDGADLLILLANWG